MLIARGGVWRGLCRKRVAFSCLVFFYFCLGLGRMDDRVDYGHGALRSREGLGLVPEELLCGSRFFAFSDGVSGV